MLNFDKVWNLYKHYYAPQRIFSQNSVVAKTAQKCASLIEIGDEYDVVLLDGFGVLNIGQIPIPKMPETIKQLQKMGKQTFVLTNGASYPSAQRVHSYPKLGYDFTVDQIISSRDVVEMNIIDHPVTKQGGTWACIVLNDSAIETIPAHTVHLSKENIDHVDGFLFLGTTHWNEQWQARLLNSLQKKNRPIIIGNPDISAPLEHGFSIEPGYYAIQLIEAISDLEIQYCGKPFANAYIESIKKINQRVGDVDLSRILMVGDTPHTDILGGNMAGMKTALMVDWGFLRGRDYEAYIHESSIYPDFIIQE